MPNTAFQAANVQYNQDSAQEARRQAALDAFKIVGTRAETAFDDIAQLAQKLCGTPLALVSLADRDRQWFKARIGTDLESVPRSLSFCDHAIRNPCEVLEVADACVDPRFRDNPLVFGEPYVRFYAAAPILTRDGEAVGTVCVIDHHPRRLTPAQRQGLQALARQVRFLLELHAFLIEQQDGIAIQEDNVRRLFAAHDALRRSHEALRMHAMQDSLTGLRNRAALQQLLDDMRGGDPAQLPPYGLVLVDIDHFKQVNDRHGHLIGDSALRMVADVVKGAIRQGDMAFRFGGEEILVYLPHASLDAARSVAERIRESVGGLGLPFPLTVSAGVAHGEPTRESPYRVFERADQALYRAKAGGRDQVVVHPGGIVRAS